MSSIVIDFEILPGEGPGSVEVWKELSQQLTNPTSKLRTGEIARFAASASISPHKSSITEVEADPVFPSTVPEEVTLADKIPPLPPERKKFPSSSGPQGPTELTPSFVHDFSIPASGSRVPFDSGPSPWSQETDWQQNRRAVDVATPNIDVSRFSHLERQLAHTAAGGHGHQDRGTRMERSVENDALEVKCTQLTQRLEATERDLREAQESARAERVRAQRFEITLKDREQLLVHAKEMWMKESARASKLVDALTATETKLADQEKRIDEVSERYNSAQQEVRHLRHLLESPGGEYAGSRHFTSSARQETFTGGDVPNGTGSTFGFPSRSFDTHAIAANTALPSEVETNADRFKHLCNTDSAVLFEDDILQIGMKSEYRNLDGQVALYFGNKGGAVLQGFTVQIIHDDRTLRLSASSLGQQLAARDQVIQKISVSYIEPFVEPPTLLVKFLLPDASPRLIQIKFPVIVTKFIHGRELSQQDFFALWRQQAYVLSEVARVVNLTQRLRMALVQIARSISFNGALRLHHGYDASPDNFVLVGELNKSAVTGGGFGLSLREEVSGGHNRGGGDQESVLTLVRVEVGNGRFDGKARVAVRCGSHTLALAVCECIVAQLTCSPGINPEAR